MMTKRIMNSYGFLLAAISPSTVGVGGVPGFIVNRKYFLSGAQPATAFHKLFDLIIGDADAERRGGAQHDAY